MLSAISKKSTIAVFSYHASERMSKRHKFAVPAMRELDLAQEFVKAMLYTHADVGECEAWIYKDISKKMMLCVQRRTKVVITVYGDSNPDAEDFKNSKVLHTALDAVKTHPAIIKANSPYNK